MLAVRRTSPSLSLFLAALATLQAGLLFAGCGSAPDAAPPARADEASVRPGANDRFLDPELDVAAFVDIFELVPGVRSLQRIKRYEISSHRFARSCEPLAFGIAI